ncbi:fimbrial protein [Pseudomonas denitrificans (nom. rej.)]|nr:fimbrial protein [Pseudomonas denitrificans (nom. rej.)]
MKYLTTYSITLASLLTLGTSHAANPDSCYWKDADVGSDTFRDFSGAPPAQMVGSGINSGQVLAKATTSYASPNQSTAVCPKSVSKIKRSYDISTSMPLLEGHSNVYDIGLKDMGVRFLHHDKSARRALPYEREAANVTTYGDANSSPDFDWEIVQTGQSPVSGTGHVNFTVKFTLNGWQAAQTKVEGPISVTIPQNFSGCSGTDNLNIKLGSVHAAELASARAKSFDLDVVCHGAAPGSNLPVSVYFEGSSDSDGHLNLNPGGAGGVEVSLTSDNRPLPFNKTSALSMSWQRTEENGEIYRLPIDARYIYKDKNNFKPGRADATMNYILEYE